MKVSSTEILHHFNVHLSFSNGSFPVSDFVFNYCNLTPAQVIPLRNQVNVELLLRHWCTAQSNSMHSRRLFSFSIRPVVVNNMVTRAFNHSQELPLHLRNYFVHSFDEKTKYYRPTVFLHNCSQLTKVFLSIFFLRIKSKHEHPCLSAYVTNTTLPQSKHKACGTQRESLLRFLLTHTAKSGFPQH